MIPFAGDEITEAIAQRYLVEFNVAEAMKTSCLKKKSVTYKDIMGTKYKLSSEEILESVSDVVHKITQSVADKIIELNGGKSVSAVFVVGGGGKIPGFVTSLAQYLELPQDRVALRGEEVLGNVTFLQEKIKKDSLLVTPIGICLTFYEKSNNFIFVTVNGVRVKLYDNDKLTISDAAIQVGFPNDKLFPRRGKPIQFMLNGSPRMVRGELGEAAHIKLNGESVGLNHRILQNDKIEIVESTVGADAVCTIGQLPEYHSTITITFNGSKILCPKFIEVNGTLVSEYYSIQDQDEIQMLNYYTLQQVLEFMDIQYQGEILVNNVAVGMEEKVYENFSITCNLNNLSPVKADAPEEEETADTEEAVIESSEAKAVSGEQIEKPAVKSNSGRDIYVTVNSNVVKLEHKENYILVDVFDFYYFDLSVMKGTELVTEINGVRVDFTAPVQEGDHILIYWQP